MPPNGTDRLKEGMATRRAVLGDQHVDRMEAGKNGFDGAVPGSHHRGGVGPRLVAARLDASASARSSPSALLAALGHYEEMAMHVRAIARTGATPEDVREVMLHVAIYAGVPTANHAIKIAKQALADVAAGRAD